jgi:putative FmdB family regulatory protein
MPLFAYHCKDCDHSFETLSRWDETPACPSCGGTQAARQLARIAKPASGGDGGETCPAMAGDPACAACPAMAGPF